MEKNSFSLIETLFSIVLLSIVIVGFSKYSYYDNFDKEFNTLNNIENSFNTKNYNSNFQTNSKTIQIIINDIEEKNINVKQISYKDERIELVKYEIK
ncbi:type IV pilus modification PilV family protein [Campylobacterota bacterium DY0563]